MNMGFGTLGCSSDDPTEFFGSNDEAYIDEDGMLHGVPPFEALEPGVMLCLSPMYEGCFYVYSALCWDGFIRTVEADLRAESDGAVDCFDRKARARAKRLLDDPPCKISADGGLIPVPEGISRACRIEANEPLRVIGNSGYFEVWRKTAFDEALSPIDFLDALLGGEGE